MRGVFLDRRIESIPPGYFARYLRRTSPDAFVVPALTRVCQVRGYRPVAALLRYNGCLGCRTANMPSAFLLSPIWARLRKSVPTGRSIVDVSDN